MSVESVGADAAGGPFALMLLNILDEYEPKKINKTELFHVLIEARFVCHLTRLLLSSQTNENRYNEIFLCTDRGYYLPRIV